MSACVDYFHFLLGKSEENEEKTNIANTFIKKEG